MLRTKVCAALAAVALTLLAVPAASAETADARTGVSAPLVEYKGGATTLPTLEKEIGEAHCHDAKGMGELTCFATERELELDLLAVGGLPADAAKNAARKWGVAVPKQTRTAAAAAAPTCHPWATMRFYDGYNATGSSVSVFCDYPDLRNVSFDNRANSAICMVCKNPFTSANPYNVKRMTAFQNYNFSVNAMAQETSVVINASALAANTASSNRIYFN
ncbi:hypothetical protein ACFCZ2_26460 [Streptomyces sp. NPDC056202]|uniref:hypothetical protein n=1 Tax=Streptomyces sp. NPDC056202 TaxID=3345745 RepID=UPI0035E13D24